MTAAALLMALDVRGDFFSPGELSRAHEGLSGIAHCTECHEAGQQLSEAKCLSCHRELQPELNKGTGFHGRIPKEARACETCHAEHQGPEHDLISWGPAGKKGFEHGKSTGWPLTGKHALVSCESCHEPRRFVTKEAQSLAARFPDHSTFLGMPVACASCHFDEHRGQLGATCQQCHTTTAWKPAPGFDHSRTDFALIGAHQKVACDACHAAVPAPPVPRESFPRPAAADTFMKFGAVAHASCQDCHKDPHEGRFGGRCQSCHTVQSWLQVHDTAKDRAFHEKTRFPLRGAHLDVACKSCHGPTPGQPARFKGLAFATCESCHADAHEGQLGSDKHRPSCSQCHTVDAFVPARFGVEEHARTPYPLKGAHAAVPCTSCHRQEPFLANHLPTSIKRNLMRAQRPVALSLWLFDIRPKTTEHCQGCHADPHAGQFAGRTCETCHGLESFHALRFQHDRDSRFPLTGAHAQVACVSCHPSVGKPPHLQFRPLAVSCAGCHEDVHAGQFTGAQGQTDCQRCHTTEAFTKTTFQHQPPFTAFLLEGKHAQVPCLQCHPDVQVDAAHQVRKFLGVPSTCAGCHADVHHGTFRGFHP